MSSSGTFPMFQNLAEELAKKLSPYEGVKAEATRNELVNIADTLRSWEDAPPSEEERKRVVDRIIELNKVAAAILAKPSSMPP